MKNRFSFYIIIAVLTILDSVLLSNPNLLGKIGLLIYKFHYLRNFPRALLTVSIVTGVAMVISELIRWLVRHRGLKRGTGWLILFLLILASVAIAVKTGMDFSKWTAGHTGARFRYGAYLLPGLLFIIFSHALASLPRHRGKND